MTAACVRHQMLLTWCLLVTGAELNPTGAGILARNGSIVSTSGDGFSPLGLLNTG